ncbi:methyltransferase [uncultured Microscilla sp.]|uniref:methyltransferase n=1 Tax=uncultured Microscilla sp. TaxID=432653 RepID=UPI0026175071|nr:methyltransferase [uncultured Microscilla sp.]
MPKQSQQNRFSELKEIPRSKIVTRRALFQGRQSKWSQESVDKIVNEGYDKSREPIEVWYDEQTDEYVVVSGHSRFEASRILLEEKGDKSLETLPVKVFLGDLESAIEYAVLESNRSGTAEGLLSDIQAFKIAREKGCVGECLRGYFKTNTYINSLQRLANLNPKGLFLEKLANAAETKSFPNLQKYAEWIGELRKQYPALTDSHENEVFNFLYLSGNKKKLPQKKEDFVQPIERALTNFFFDKSKPLNLQNFATKTPYTIAADAQKKELQQKIDNAEKRIKQLRGLIAKAKKEKKQKLVTQFEEEIARRNKEIIAHNERIEKITSGAKQAEKQAPGLFDDLHEEEESVAGKKEKEPNQAPEPEEEGAPTGEKQEKTPVQENEEDQTTKDDIQLIDYSEKSIALMGNTKPYAEKLGRRGLGGKFNKRLTHPKTGERFMGWVFPVAKKEVVEEFLLTKEVAPQEENGEPTQTEKKYTQKVKLPFRQHLEVLITLKELEEEIQDSLGKIGEEATFGTGWKHIITPEGGFQYNTEEGYSVTPKLSVHQVGELIYVYAEYAQSESQQLRHVRKATKVKKSEKKETVYGQENIETISQKPAVRVPTRLFVPKDKRKPYYDFGNRDTKVRGDVLRMEVLLGKMKIVQTYGWKPLEGYYGTLEDSIWYVPNPNELPRVFYTEAPYWQYGSESVSWRNAAEGYSLMYTGKNTPAYIDFSKKLDKEGNRELSEEDKERQRLARIKKFRSKAETLRRWNKQKKAELKHQHRNTPKRNKEWKSKDVEADIHEETAEVYEAIANALESKTISPLLDRVFVSPKENPIYFLLPQRDGSREGYYGVFRDTRPEYQNYKDNPTPYMKSLGEKYGLTSYEDWDNVHKELEDLLGGEEKKAKDEKKKREQRLKELIDEWRFSKEDGFHPTPEEIIEDMVDEADIEPEDTILEPSAGLGHIAEEIREDHPKNSLEVLEKWDSLREILELKGFSVVGNDTLKHYKKYDKVLMNPPFEKGQDIQHVQHVYEHNLEPGGRLIAIMSRGNFDKNSRLKARQQFNTWLDEVGAHVEELPENAFKSSFRPTGVQTNMVKIDKPEDTTPTPKNQQKPIAGKKEKEVQEAPKQDNTSNKRKAIALAKAKERERKRRLRLIQI